MKGGYRPGGGRPKGSKDKKPRKRRSDAGKPKAIATQKQPKLPPDVQQEAADENLSPLDYMLKIMRDRNQPADRRDRMAQLAAPFVHPRAGESKGKKEEKADRAKAAGSGKFAPARPPLSVVK